VFATQKYIGTYGNVKNYFIDTQWRVYGQQPPLSKQVAVANITAYGHEQSLCDRLSPAVQSASPF